MTERRSSILRCALLGLVAGFLASSAVGAETSQATGTGAPPDSFLLKGVVADAKGPLANRVVIVSPIDAKTGEAPTRYTIVGGQPGPMMNPKTTTDAEGAFSVSVPRSLFKDPPDCFNCSGWKTGELSLAVYTDKGGGSFSTSLKAAIVKYDEKAATVDAGRLVLEPLR